ncbi:MAG: hypothetical protein LLF98_07970 [Clostridium sp.]|uniref:hypothetical protein n=1 Tax=Clostridium sp. TaxID=1506 RepID=UPI0025BBDCFB|nr:hypothetical protein [Clostridium sp.]MCE5221192.1 hypothetical protein [Clostridium sp.]
MAIKDESKILDAIRQQRWYFLKNKPNILFDKETGYLWPNLKNFKYVIAKGKFYTKEQCKSLAIELNLDGFGEWELPEPKDIRLITVDKEFPFFEGSNYKILGHNSVYIYSNYIIESAIKLDSDYPMLIISDTAYFIPVNKNVSSEEYIKGKKATYLSKEEKLNLTLELFKKYEFEPIFDNDEITQLYKKIYLDNQNNNENRRNLNLKELNYVEFIKLYDIEEINTSIIKYYEGIQNWIYDLLKYLDAFELSNNELIREINEISFTVSKVSSDKYNLSEQETELFNNRINLLKEKFNISIGELKNKLIVFKVEADKIEEKIEEINGDNNILNELGKLEKEDRASFKFITENTFNILKKALSKVKYIEVNREFVINIIKIENIWNENYKTFKSKLKEDFSKDCEEDSIEKELIDDWFIEWNRSRYIIEEKLSQLIKLGIDSNVEHETVGALINILQTYKDEIDKFYIKERKGIYQKFAFQAGGDLQEKFEVESLLYKTTAKLEEKLQDIIFDSEDSYSKINILRWAEEIINIQVDEVLEFIENKELSNISKDVLIEFSKLRENNYTEYISDIKSYVEERAIREKQYNSLMFKMRKELMR